MYALLRSFLFLLPTEAAHRLVLKVLAHFSSATWLCRILRARAVREISMPTEVCGLQFPNPVGLAAGLDKDAEAVPAFFACGFGFVEVGTLTPRAQPGNPKPRLFRLSSHRALINRMGFNNQGARTAAARLRSLAFHPAPVGVNIGKNKDTPLEKATDDYIACVDALAPCGDYVVVNASSPNTPGLRQLQEPEALKALLAAVRHRLQEVAPGKPLFLKIAPDLGMEAVDAIVDVALETRCDGLIATNTTVSRPVAHALCAEAGGFSGAPMKSLSSAVIRRAYLRSKGKLPIIGVGGVMSAEDAYEKLRQGASLIQVYTGFVYEGPRLVRNLLLGLQEKLARDGFSSLSQAVGADCR